MNLAYPEHSTILITGSSGFIGGFLVEDAISRGMNVLAAIRPTSDKKYLNNPKVQFLELDFSSVDNLSTALANATNEFGKIDYIIHNAGITKASKESHYFQTNTNYTSNFLKALVKVNITATKFIFMSSLAAYGPGDPKSFEPIKNTDTPSPISAYGKSKLMAEQLVKSQHSIPWLIIRPTAVFGPREKEIFAMFKLINRNIHPRINVNNQRMSFIYIKDLTRAIIDLTVSSHSNKAYFISDGETYSGDLFGEYIKKHLGKRTLNFSVSGKFLKTIANGLEGIYSITRKTPGLNSEKAQEMICRNWICDISPLISDIGFKPLYSLEGAIKETTNWYKAEGWL